jgi:LuxR family transcriptional regulator
MTNVKAMAEHLARLSALCDTGYALAIHIKYTRPALLYRTYTQEWIDHYSEKGLMLVDPVVRWGITNTGLVQWDDLSHDDSAGVLTDARRFGLTNGITYSVGNPSSRTIAGFTKSGTAFSATEVAEMTGIVDTVHALTEGVEQFDAKELEALRAL